MMAEYRRRLPHIHPEGAYLFLTWRLYGSLPKQRDLLGYPSAGHAFLAQDRALHEDTTGPRWMMDARVATVVSDGIVKGAGEKGLYELRAWVVMPNHVHLVILPIVPVPAITRWLKASTAALANRMLGRTGQPFWQDESYDHYLRNPDQVILVIRYIERNPVSAGFVQNVEDWAYSSAGVDRHTVPLLQNA